MRKIYMPLVLWIVVTAGLSGIAAAIAQGTQNIVYNATYDCPTRGGYGRMQFKVLSCGGNGWCQMWMINSSPEGGYKDEWQRKEVIEYLKKKDNAGKGCTVNGAPVVLVAEVAPTAAKNGAAKSTPPKKAKAVSSSAGTCASVAPPGKVTRNARPSVALFKRVIYERYRMMDKGRQVGMSFKTFGLERSYVNRLTGSGLLHDGAPQNAKVYRYKTNYTHCVKYTDSILRYDVTDGYFSCFKDKQGDWACTNEGDRGKKQTYLPIK